MQNPEPAPGELAWKTVDAERQLAELERKLGIAPSRSLGVRMNSDPLNPEDGGAGVAAQESPFPTLLGPGARRFEEALEAPRNP